MKRGRGDGLETPSVLYAKAEEVLEDVIKTGTPFSKCAEKRAVEDPLLDGLADWVMVAYIRGLGLTAADVAKQKAHEAARQSRTKVGATKAEKLSEEAQLLALLSRPLMVGAESKEMILAPASMWRGYVDNTRSKAEGLGQRADWAEFSVLPKLKKAHANTIAQLPRETWLALARELAGIMNGEREKGLAA